MSLQPDLFEVDKSRHGAVWVAGSFECRNFHGYYQCREGGEGKWRFQVPWFGCDERTCTVYTIDEYGGLQHEKDVPIDDLNRITIRGRRYSPDYWDH